MSLLTLAEASRIVREAVKDRSYRATPLGNRTRVVFPQVWLTEAVYGNRRLPTAVLHVRHDLKGSCFAVGCCCPSFRGLPL